MDPASRGSTDAGVRWDRHTARAAAWVAVVLVVFGVAARCRFYARCPSYWYDEAYLLLNVFARGCGDLLGPLDHQQAAPPLFLLLLRGLYRAAGSGEWLMRLPAFAAGLAGLGLVVPLARLVVGRPGWPWVVGLCAVCHHAVAHGGEVKPYAIDLLVSEAVLLAAAALVLPGVSDGWRRVARAALLSSTVVGPWLSYPSLFVLGAALAGLCVQWLRRREHGLGRTVVILTLLLSVSVAALWWVAVRHQQTHDLQQWWAEFFPDVSTPARAAAWVVGYLVHVGHYGATGLGAPLLLLALPGWAVLWRRSPGLLVLTAGPLALAWVAGVLRAYPLGDRLVMFAAPCLWLPAGAGAGLLVRGLGRLADRGRVRWAAVGWLALAGGMMLPGAARMVKELAAGPVMPEFREAFALVDTLRLPGDRLWVSHPQVYEVYHGRPAWLMGAYTPPAEVRQAARAGHVWAVFTPQLPGLTLFPELFTALAEAGCVPVETHKLGGVEIVLFAPRAVGPPSPPAPRHP
jgi:hypothetical protein